MVAMVVLTLILLITTIVVFKLFYLSTKSLMMAVVALSLTTLNEFCINHGDQRFDFNLQSPLMSF